MLWPTSPMHESGLPRISVQTTGNRAKEVDASIEINQAVPSPKPPD
jgi:hypothetical protein